MSTENQTTAYQLTEAQILEIGKQADKIKKEKRLEQASQRKALKELKDSFTEGVMEIFIPIKENVAEYIDGFFDKYKIISEFDVELNGQGVLTQDTQSHTHSDKLSGYSIGYNMVKTFDGSEGVGVEKVKQYIDSLRGEDENSKKLADALNIFLKPHPITGMLNPDKLQQLSKMRDEYDDALFTEGMEIINKATIKVRNSQFVEGWQMVTQPNGQFKKIEFRFTV